MRITVMRITSVTCRVLPLYLGWPCMGYTALLFCPDEKTARTVTQVLSELEFAVENCAEPFAAVKKLMGQHFDAVVVDCDNEQNATLLFKSARNSASNQNVACRSRSGRSGGGRKSVSHWREPRPDQTHQHRSGQRNVAGGARTAAQERTCENRVFGTSTGSSDQQASSSQASSRAGKTRAGKS